MGLLLFETIHSVLVARSYHRRPLRFESPKEKYRSPSMGRFGFPTPMIADNQGLIVNPDWPAKPKCGCRSRSLLEGIRRRTILFPKAHFRRAIPLDSTANAAQPFQSTSHFFESIGVHRLRNLSFQSPGHDCFQRHPFFNSHHFSHFHYSIGNIQCRSHKGTFTHLCFYVNVRKKRRWGSAPFAG